MKKEDEGGDLVEHRTIGTKEFLIGLPTRHHPPTTHNLRAHLEGRSVIVTDPDGNEVEVSYGSTNDSRTVTAHVHGLGFIGGWQHPHRAMPWAYLVDSINQGVLYHCMNDLPKRKHYKKRG